METSKSPSGAYHPRDVGEGLVKRAALLAALLAIAPACRQIVGIQQMPKPCADPQMIDDMEDGDAYICNSNKRQGAWYSVGDETAGDLTLEPNATIPGGRGPSRRAVHFTGGGFTDWGAIAGFNLNSDGFSRGLYDASSVGGLTFWMKSTVPVTVQAQLPATTLVAEGGQCVAGTSASNCNDAFAFKIAAPGSAWTQVQVPFSALQQSPTGTATWDPRSLLSVQFLVGAAANFDVWIDDVAFYYCTNTECVPTCTDPAFSVACPKDNRHAAACFPAGATCADVDTWCADPMLIDDMEDGDDQICASGGRHGKWYTFRDTSPGSAQFAIDQIPGGRGSSARAAHLTGSGLTDWGAGMGMTLQSASGDGDDASAAGGVHFWMRGAGTVRVQLRLPATTPIAYPPGTCTTSCDNHFHFVIPSTGDEWVEYRVPFAALRQEGALGTVSWDPSHLLAVEFSVVAQDFDVWVDDVSFYTCTGDACVPTCIDPASPVACPVSGSYPANCWPAGTDCANPPDSIFGYAVWGSGSADVWIAGSSPADEKGRARHWNGAGWTSGAGAAAPAIFGLWGSATDDVWSVGVGGTIRHWSGSDWTTLASGTTADLLQGIWGTAPNDVWASGAGGAIVHWDGNRWSAVQSPTTQDLWGLWTSGPTDGWAVGVGGTLLRLTSAGWTSVASGTSVQLDGVWGSSPNDVWAVGQGGTILHWNGSAWISVPSGTTRYLDGVWGSGPDDVWAVGDGGTILHWNGSWAAAVSNTSGYLSCVWGSSPTDIWASGDATVHYDGMRWSVISTDTTAQP